MGGAKGSQPADSWIRSEIGRRIEAHGLSGSRMLVAVSGGPDSLALVHALGALRRKLDLRLFAAHLDHGLRSEASAADVEFVRSTMNDLSIPLTVARADVPSYREAHGLSLEEAARQVRYRFLAHASDDVAADVVAIGHTLDDQAETVLMHLIRGSGLTGLRSMSTLSETWIGGRRMKVFRPLIKLTKSDTLAYCAAIGLSPRIDESNMSTKMTRNRVRLDLIPHLESFNPAVAAALARLAESTSHDIDFIHQEVDRATPEVITKVPSGVVLEKQAFARLHPSIKRYLLRRAIEMTAGTSIDIQFTHLEEIVGLMEGPAGKRTYLPGQLVLEIDYERAYLRSGAAPMNAPQEVEQNETRMTVPGYAVSGGWRFRARVVTSMDIAPAPTDALGLRLSERLDADRLGTELIVRPRTPQDVFWPLGMTREKRLTNFMKDSHMPRRWRNRIPLITTISGEIAWVVGWRIADWAKVTDETGRIVELSCSYSDASLDTA